MPTWISENDRTIIDVTEPIETLWIGRVSDDAIRLQETVDIRRKPLNLER